MMSNIDSLIELMSKLRDPVQGCPWDLKQSITSLLPHTLEEVYEVADAIESGSMVELEDELGDLLFQIVFYAQLAREEGSFDFDDIAAGVTNKLLRRHPHVFPDGTLASFGETKELSAEQVVANWDAIKEIEREEKRQKLKLTGQEQIDSPASLLDDVPKALPAMERARKLQKRAASVGFDWKEIEPVLMKLKEEIAELEEAIVQGQTKEIEHELGDVLFASVNLARHAKVEPEIALRGCNSRFEARFRFIEKQLQIEETEFKNKSLEDLDHLWDLAKQSGL
jgi:ATP diphosphatase